MFFILGLFSSTAFYGVMAFIASTIVFHVSLADIFSCAFTVTNLHETFLAYMGWSIPAYIALQLLHIIFSKISDRIDGFGMSTDLNIGTFLSWVGADITNPFRGLFSLIGARKVIDSSGLWFIHDWGEVILHFVWAIALVVWLILGFMSII